jgi:quinol monooxygenase YgiN
MKTISTTIAAVTMFILAACSGGSEKTTATKDSTKTKAEIPVSVAPPAFVPFKVFSARHTVKNFDVWKKSFDEHESMRVANGLSKLAVCRDMAKPNLVYVFLKAADIQKAKDFATNPSLKKAMKEGGVIGVPTFAYSDVLRFAESPVEYKNRVRINHKVKDFDAWLKVFDAEGKETRAANGLIDRALSRNIADPNQVSITFAISDMAKVKARLKDPALKKIMKDAGVISAPIIDFYTAVD